MTDSLTDPLTDSPNYKEMLSHLKKTLLNQEIDFQHLGGGARMLNSRQTGRSIHPFTLSHIIVVKRCFD